MPAPIRNASRERAHLWLVPACALLALASAAPAALPTADADALLARVKILTGQDLAGRGSGTAEAEKAAGVISDWFAALGLEPAFAGGYVQEFPLAGQNWAGQEIAGRTGRNVAGMLRGKGDLADRWVIVGAHYDHLGVVVAGDSGLPAEDGDYYPGANDNASGVTVMVELARLARLRLQAGMVPGSCRGVLFVAFDAEEIGLQGSGYLAGHPPVARGDIDAMVNLDTVGQLQENRLFLGGVGTALDFGELVARANSGGLDLVLNQGGWSGSDHMSFNLREIPVLFLFSGPYPQYNRTTDAWPTLNHTGLVAVAGFADRLVQELVAVPRAPTWVEVAEPDSLPQATGEGVNRRTWFGSIPDFSPGVAGYQLGGVFDGSPAAAAGLQKGDVLVRLGGREVTDLQSFTRALRSHAPGALVEVSVLRSGRRLNFTVVLGDRADRP